jgi:hypothetical protein
MVTEAGAPIRIDVSEASKVIDPKYSQFQRVIASRPVYEKDYFRPLARRDKILQAQSDPSTKDNRAKAIARDRFEDQYDDDYKERLINAAVFDANIQQPLLIRINYILSHNMNPILKPKRRIDDMSAQQAQELLNTLVDPAVQEKASHYIWVIENDVIPFRSKLESALFTAFTGGRSALLKEPMIKENPWLTLDGLPFPEGTPAAYKILNYQHLGQVFVNPDSWEVEGIEYKDNIFEEDNFSFEMPREWLIYFTHMDTNIIPYSLHYGNSVIPPIMPISENNRRINEIVFPEIDESLWAGTGHWKVNDIALFDQQQFVDSIAPARFLVYQKSDMEFEEIKLSYDTQGLLAQRQQNIVLILQQMRLPSPFWNMEQVTNRATMEIVADVWNETTLEGDRRWVRDTLHRDHYTPLLELITGESIFTLKMTVMLEFQKVTFADIQSKATALAALLALPIPPIDESEARQMLGLPPQRVAILAEAGIVSPQQKVRELHQVQMEKQNELFQKVNKNVDGGPDYAQIPISNYILSRRLQTERKNVSR